MILHRGTHPNLDVEGCFGCRIASVAMAASAQPSRFPDAADKKQMVAGWNKDHDAYRRLVKNGVQPKSLDGAHFLEQMANTKAEVEQGIGAPKELDAA